MHARQCVPHAAGIRCAHFGRLHNFAFHTTAQWERHLVKLTLILQGTVEFSVGAESREQFSRQRVCQRTKICIHVQHMALCANNIPTAATIDAHRASGRAYKKTSHNCTRTSQSHHHYVQNEEWWHNNSTVIPRCNARSETPFPWGRQTSPQDTRRSCRTIDVGDAQLESHSRSVTTYRCGR